MKVDLIQTINGYDGKPLMSKVEGVEAFLPDGNPVFLKYGLKVKDPYGKEVELIDGRSPKTIGEALLECVTTPLKKDAEHTPEQRRRLFELAQMFYANKGGIVNLTAEDVVELKSRCHILYLDPQVFSAVVDALESEK